MREAGGPIAHVPILHAEVENVVTMPALAVPVTVFAELTDRPVVRFESIYDI